MVEIGVAKLYSSHLIIFATKFLLIFRMLFPAVQLFMAGGVNTFSCICLDKKFSLYKCNCLLTLTVFKSSEILNIV